MTKILTKKQKILVLKIKKITLKHRISANNWHLLYSASLVKLALVSIVSARIKTY